MSEVTVEIDPRRLPKLLRTDREGKIRDAAIAEMNGLAAGIRKRLDAGVSPSEFQRLTKIEAGLKASTGVVAATWKALQEAAAPE